MISSFSFIGVGNMASAIISGIKNKNIYLFDIDRQKCDSFADERHFTVGSIKEAVGSADCVFLSVKPQNINTVLDEIKPLNYENKLFVSIAAGISIDHIQSYLENAKIVRTMPNAPIMIGKGITALCRNKTVNDKDFSEICHIFSEMGKVTVIDEDKINAITAVTSSSPAYVYLFVKAICDSGVKLGLDEQSIKNLVCQMVTGSIGMLENSDLTIDELISKVTSPNGTTEAAMKVFKDKDFCGIIDEAIIKCTERAAQLQEENKK